MVEVLWTSRSNLKLIARDFVCTLVGDGSLAHYPPKTHILESPPG